MSKIYGKPLMNFQTILVLNEQELQILNHLCSYRTGLTKVLREHVTTCYTDKAINDFFDSTLNASNKILTRITETRKVWNDGRQ